jgi:hypothetical protein
VVDTAGFRFANLTEFDDANFLPGAVKYGDLPGMLALVAGHPLWLAGEKDQVPAVLKAAYKAADKTEVVQTYAGDEQAEATAAVDWLLK